MKNSPFGKAYGPYEANIWEESWEEVKDIFGLEQQSHLAKHKFMPFRKAKGAVPLG